MWTRLAAAVAAVALSVPAHGEETTFAYRSLTLDAALKAAQAALAKCRNDGYQVAVAVVDRGGHVQALLRDRYAGPHTLDSATGKAWTAVSFRRNTSELLALTAPGQPGAGLRDLPGVVALGGGIMVEAGGNIVAGIGVAGAPGGHLDDACANAGLAAIAAGLEF